jgi:hypothetical protein
LRIIVNMPTKSVAHKPKPLAKPQPPASLAERVATLEDAVARLSKLVRSVAAKAAPKAGAAPASTAATPALPTAGEDRFWALNGLHTRNAAQGLTNGGVLYTGRITTSAGRQYSWQRQEGTDELMVQDWSTLSDTVAALGHPVRLGVLKACLGNARSTQDLLALPNMGTTGQLFHHLKALQQAGWLRSLQRGTYEVPADRIVPLLTILLAAKG